MANYNLTEQTISSSFQQLLQYDRDTGSLYDGTGSLITNIEVTSSFATTASYAINHDDPTWDEIQNKPSGIVSGAAQIDELLPSGTVSGSDQVLGGTNIVSSSQQVIDFLPSGTVSGSTQIIDSLPSGTVSGSSQITDGSGIVSGSYVSSIIAGNNISIDQGTGNVTISSTTTASADWNNLTNKPDGIVSGSSQIILQDTSGDLSASRIDGQVASALSASYALTASVLLGSIESASYADNALSASHALNADNAISALRADFADETDDVILNVKNTSGADIGKGLAVHATGVTGENVNIKLADSSVSGDMPAIGITRDAISNNAIGVVILSGKVRGLNTSTDGLVAGAAIYVNGAGVLTASKPTGSDLIQNIGICGKVDATDGEIIVMGSGRSNDLPNIQEGYAWVGDSNGVPSALPTASIIESHTGSFAKLDEPNTFIDAQTIESTLIVSQSAGITGSIMHFPQTGGGGLQGIASNRFFNVGPNLFEQSYQGIDKYILQTVGTGEMEISAATSIVLNPATSGNGSLVSTKIMTNQDSSISGNGQKDAITIGAYTGSNGVIYTSNVWGLQNYPSSGYNNAFTIGKYNSSFNKVSEARVDEGKVQLTIANGDFDYDYIQIADNNAGTTQITLKGDILQGAVNQTNLNNVQIGVNNPASQSLFVSDGAAPRLQVYSQTDAGSSGINIELSGATSVDDLIINGKVSSELQAVGISNNTASIDFESAQMAVLDLPATGDTLFNLQGAGNGQVLNLLVKQGGAGTVSLPSNVKMASGSAYAPTSGAGSRDLLTFATYDFSTTSEIYLVNAVNLV